MRISSSQIYDIGLRNIGRSQSQLVRLQDQISTGRRMLTPADDPVAAAQALTVTQSKEVAAQYVANQHDARDKLRLADTQLGSLTDVLQGVRSRLVQAGSTILADSDRQTIASELSASLDQVIGLANSRTPAGDYLFSGYQGNVVPFVRSAASAAATPQVVYLGDDGDRLVQVASSQTLATNVAGSDLLMNIREGNGFFAAAATGNGVGLVNQGSGMIDSGTVLDTQKWQQALESGFPWQGTTNRALEIRFTSPSGVSSYQIFDVSQPAPPAAAVPAVAVSAVTPFAAGQSIPLQTTGQPPAAAVSTDFGAQVVISGLPVNGDTFTIRPSANKSVFSTIQDTIDLLRTPLTSTTARTEYSGKLHNALLNLDNALASVGRAQASVGSRLQALDNLGDSASSLDIQYQQTLSDLQDLDYAQAISDFTKHKIGLEAAQKSYVQISDLSLFKYI
ncbi:MAG: flagellar hook-associated protein FlgL [Candidatus Accumulibacter sp.]|nr:flagellar hook-associated protein FlgL [Accumulibacter sp.]